MNAENSYYPELTDKDAELIKKAGHGGGDFFVIRKFFESIRTGTKPEMDEAVRDKARVGRHPLSQKSCSPTAPRSTFRTSRSSQTV